MLVQRNEVIQQIADITAETLLDFNIKKTVADDIGVTLADALSSRFGGQNFFIPHRCTTESNSADEAGRFRARGMKKRRDDLLAFITETIFDLVEKIDDETLDSEDIADAVVNNFCRNFSGSNLPLPKDKRFKTYQRDQKIMKEFNGLNYDYLSEKYGISVNALYRVTKKY